MIGKILNKIKKKKGILIKLFYLIVIILIFDTYGMRYGIYSILILTGLKLLILIYALYTNKTLREFVMGGIRQIETILFTRPLDKEYWQDGAKPKLPKIIWKKKKQLQK